MKNVFKILSNQKDVRIAIVNTKMITLPEIPKDSGMFLKEILTSCILFSALNDFQIKTSFNLRIDNSLKVYCLIENNRTEFEFSSKFNNANMNFKEFFQERSILSVTMGDYSGLHTSTILANNPNFSEILGFFSKQSEQLPTEFLINPEYPSYGIAIQPLPFASVDSVNYLSDNLSKRLSDFSNRSLEIVPEMFSDIGTILWEKKVM